jgi:hypothetical protein
MQPVAGHASAAAAVMVGYQIVPAFALELGGLVGSNPGALVRAAWIPFNATGKVKPLVALEVPLLFTSPLSAGVGLTLGVHYQPARWISLGLEAPAVWFFNAPSWATQRRYLFVGPVIGLHL